MKHGIPLCPYYSTPPLGILPAVNWSFCMPIFSKNYD